MAFCISFARCIARNNGCAHGPVRDFRTRHAFGFQKLNTVIWGKSAFFVPNEAPRISNPWFMLMLRSKERARLRGGASGGFAD